MIRAFRRMLEINKGYEHIEVTANFLLGEELPSSHIPSLLKQIGAFLGKHMGKGCIYFHL